MDGGSKAVFLGHTMSYVASEAPHDTSLSPVLFAEGEDRREGARVPLSRPVRVGPAGGEPEALVSARDLSVGGIFVDADRPVREGAKFCISLDLPGADGVYIAEAEVAYNRQAASGSGFGVRFIALSSEARAAIQAEVDRQTQDLMPLTPLDVESDLPTLAPSPAAAPSLSQYAIETDQVRKREAAAASTVDTELEAATSMPVTETQVEASASLPPEPDFDSHLLSPSELPTPEAVSDTPRRARVEVMQEKLQSLRETLSRTGPGILLLAGVAMVVTVALLSWMDGVSPNEAVAAPASPTVTGRTHQVLMGEAEPQAVTPSADPAATDHEVKKPLPPLVVLPKKAAPAAKVAPAKAPAAVAAADAVKPEAPKKAASNKPEAPKKATPKPAQAPAPKKPAADDTAAAPSLSPAARALLGESAARVSLALDAGAKVKKSYALHSPERYVIDIVGQSEPLALPAAAGAVKKIRSGRHPDYIRVVLDLDRAVDDAQLTRTARGVDVKLDLR